MRTTRARVRQLTGRINNMLKGYPGEASERGGRLCIAAPAGACLLAVGCVLGSWWQQCGQQYWRQQQWQRVGLPNGACFARVAWVVCARLNNLTCVCVCVCCMHPNLPSQAPRLPMACCWVQVLVEAWSSLSLDRCVAAGQGQKIGEGFVLCYKPTP